MTMLVICASMPKGRDGVGDAVGVSVNSGVLVNVRVSVIVGVSVTVGVNVIVGVSVTVGVRVMVGVSVTVGINVIVGVSVGARVIVGAGVLVGSAVHCPVALRNTGSPEELLKFAFTTASPAPSNDTESPAANWKLLCWLGFDTV